MSETHQAPGGGAASAPPWTADEDRRLQDMRDQGKSAREIAQVLNRTRFAVLKRFQQFPVPETSQAKAIHFKAPQWTKEECDRALDLVDEGKTYDEIGEIMGRTAWAVKHRVKLLRKGKQAWEGGIKAKPGRKPKAQTQAPPPAPPLEAIPFKRVKFRDFYFSHPDLRALADQNEFRKWLALLQERDPWPPQVLYDLLEGLMTGRLGTRETLRTIGRRIGLTEPQVLARWNKMTLPIKNERGIVTTNGVKVLADTLRQNLETA